MNIRNLIYAILLGISMAACLSQQDEQPPTDAAITQEEEDSMNSDVSTEAPALLPEPASFVIAKGHVGDVKIGMPIEQLRTDVPMGFEISDTTLTQEGQQSTAYLFSPQGQSKGLLVEQQCNEACKVWRISVRSPDYKTAKGLGVGSKLGELQQAYNINSVSFEEGNLVAIAPETGMSFVLDHEQLSEQQLAKVSATNVPANTLVRKVLVY